MPWVMDCVHGTPQHDGAMLSHSAEEARLRFVGGRLQPASGYRSASPAARRMLARTGAILRLRERGKFHVHAAAVVTPDGRAWLLTGDSGSGKSTLAYALARRGWPVLGDDGVLVELSDGALVAHAWREPLMVSLGLSCYFPELASLPSSAGPVDSRRRVPVTVQTARRAEIAGVLFVRQGTGDRVERLPGTAALAGLIRQSRWLLLDDRCTVPHLRLLERLATVTPVYRLTHTSRQLTQLPAMLASLSESTTGNAA